MCNKQYSSGHKLFFNCCSQMKCLKSNQLVNSNKNEKKQPAKKFTLRQYQHSMARLSTNV